MSTTVRVVRSIPQDVVIDEMELLVPASTGVFDKGTRKNFILLSWNLGERIKAPEMELIHLQRAVVRIRDVYVPFVDVTKHFGTDKLNDWFRNLIREPERDMMDVSYG